MLANDKVTRGYYEVLLVRALRLTHDRDRARDLVQDTLERCLRRPPRDLSGGGLLPWLFVVMRRLFIDSVRTPRFRWLELADMEDPRPSISAAEQEERPLWQMFRYEDVVALVGTLPDHLRRPYEMHVMSYMSYQRIATVLDLSIGTVGTRIFRARRYLRDTLLDTVPRGERGREPLARREDLETTRSEGVLLKLFAANKTGEHAAPETQTTARYPRSVRCGARSGAP